MEQNEDRQTLMTLRQASQYLTASESFVRKLVRTEVIPHYRVGNKMLRFRRADLDEWLSGAQIRAEVTETNQYGCGTRRSREDRSRD